MIRPADSPPSASPDTRRVRWHGGLLLACCVGLLVFAGYLDSPVEAATKAAAQQRTIALSTFGYPGCGFKRVTSMPCASCGMTTSFAYLADGYMAAAFAAQPAGALLGVGTAMMGLIGAWSLLTAMPLSPVYRAVFRARNVLFAVGLILAAWAFNIIQTLGA